LMCRYYIKVYHVKTGYTEKIAKKAGNMVNIF